MFEEYTQIMVRGGGWIDRCICMKPLARSVGLDYLAIKVDRARVNVLYISSYAYRAAADSAPLILNCK